MTVFADTSALYAVVDGDDEHHAAAGRVWERVLLSDEDVLTTNYVIVETATLLQSRVGFAPLRRFFDDVVPALEVDWVSPEDHAHAVAALLAAGRRKLSLVDCTSFAVMRRQRIERSFAFDRHFGEHGFRALS